LKASVSSLTRVVSVRIQNRSSHTETITNADILASAVTLTPISLGACPAPGAVLLAPAKFPLTVKSKGQFTVHFLVTYGCANDAAKTTPQNPGHDDYRYTATVNRAALDGMVDVDPRDDVCPRSVKPPFVIDVNPDGTIRDKGCGGKKTDGTFGADVLTDVVVK